jgi:hypothetical protein
VDINFVLGYSSNSYFNFCFTLFSRRFDDSIDVRPNLEDILVPLVRKKRSGRAQGKNERNKEV